jgi:membrane protease YdiL (CAAX protease family)
MVAMIGRIAIILFVVWIGDGSLNSLGIAKLRNWKLAVVTIGCAFIATLAIEFIPPMVLSRETMRFGRMGHSPSYSLLSHGVPLTLTLIALVFSVTYEELFSRGYLIGRLREQFGNYWAPILISSILFGAMHLYQGYYGAIIATLLGVVFGFVFAITQRIWHSIIVHYLLDAYLICRYAYLLGHPWSFSLGR